MDYGVVVALESLEHATDLPAVLRHFSRALLPGGALVVATDLARSPSVQRQAHVNAIWLHEYRQHWAGPHTSAWSPPLPLEWWQQEVARAGFRLAEHRPLSSKLMVRSRRGLATYFGMLQSTFRFATAAGMIGLASVISSQVGGVARELLLHDEAMEYSFLVFQKIK